MDTIPYTFSLYCEFCTKPGWCLACLNVSSCSSLPCISRIKLLPGPDSSAAFIYHSLVGLSFRTPVCCRMYLARQAACTLLCCVKPTPQGCSSLQPLHWGIKRWNHSHSTFQSSWIIFFLDKLLKKNLHAATGSLGCPMRCGYTETWWTECSAQQNSLGNKGLTLHKSMLLIMLQLKTVLLFKCCLKSPQDPDTPDFH